MPREKQPTPAEIMARECIAVRVRALNRTVTSLYDDALRPHGLRVGQLNLLVAIARMVTARAGDLCRVLRMEKSTLSRDVEVMRRNGWLDVDESAGGRARPLRLTPAGQALLESVLPAWQKAQTQALALLGAEGATAVVEMARRLHSGAGQGL